MDRIHIYQQHKLDETLLIDSFEELTTRTESIGVEEGMKLGLRTSLQIAQAREMSRGPDTGGGLRSPSVVRVNGEDLRGLISRIFDLPRIHTNGAADAGPFTAPVNHSGKIDRASTLPAVSNAFFTIKNLRGSDGHLYCLLKTAPTTPSKPGALSQSASTSEEHPPTNDIINPKVPPQDASKGSSRSRKQSSKSRWPNSSANL